MNVKKRIAILLHSGTDPWIVLTQLVVNVQLLFSHDDVRGKTLVTYVVVCLGQIQHLFRWILFVFDLCFFQGCHSGLICLVKIADI